MEDNWLKWSAEIAPVVEEIRQECIAKVEYFDSKLALLALEIAAFQSLIRFCDTYSTNTAKEAELVSGISIYDWVMTHDLGTK